jgi:mannonate dehydratase
VKITDAKVFVACPGRNFVTLKLSTDEGVCGLGDATRNGRELSRDRRPLSAFILVQ